ALSADFPAPSGIVDNSLALPGPGTGAMVEAGVQEFYGPYLFATGYTSGGDGKWGVRAGFQGQFAKNFGDGSPAEQHAGGLVASFAPDASASVRAFASIGYIRYPG